MVERGVDMPTSSVGRILAACAILTLAPGALADGKYLPLVAYPKTPEIPAQRAILAFRNGQETLIVESAVQTDSPRVGWILPLPAEPTQISPVDPGVMNTVWFCTRPEIVSRQRTGVHEGGIPATILFLLAVPLAFLKGPNWGRYRAIFAIATVCVVVALALFATLGRDSFRGRSEAGSAKASGVSVLQARQVGSYDVKVLRAQVPEALSDWLGENGLRRLEGDDQGVIADYISKGWVFSVAVLRPEKATPSAAHPLSVSFATARPIYPMRLTAGAGSTVALELYVISDLRAGHHLLGREFAYQYKPQIEYVLSGPYEKDLLYGGQVSDGIGLPALTKLMWPGCFLTKLTGSLGPEQMKQDIVPALEAGGPERRRYYTPAAAVTDSSAIALAGLLVATLTLVLWRPSPASDRRRRLVLALVLVVAVGGAWCLYLALPKVTEAEVSFLPAYGPPLADLIHPWIGPDGSAASGKSAEAVAEEFLKLLHDGPYWEQNRYLGGKVRRESSPGNFTIETIGGNVYFAGYDNLGRPWTVKLSARPVATTGPAEPSQTRPSG